MKRLRIADCGVRMETASAAAFSIAEVMISLVILGLGLLFIAAALPAGIDYVRQTSELAQGQVAGDQGFDQLALNLRTARRLAENVPGLAINVPQRRDGIFRPRNPTAGPSAYQVDDDYEPFFKVRPVTMWNISNTGGGALIASGVEVVDDGEAPIRSYLSSIGVASLTRDITTLKSYEADVLDGLPNEVNYLLVNCPAVSSLGRMYPPGNGEIPLKADDFLNSLRNNAANVGYRAYSPADPNQYPIIGSASLPATRAAMDRRIGWTAFYRRIQYDKVIADPGTGFNPGRIQPSDPLAYELIIVVTRRPSAAHRYAKQFLTGNATDFSAPSSVNPAIGGGANDSDRLLPTPWLVTMLPNTAPTPGLPPEGLDPNNYNLGPFNDLRVVRPTFVEPTRLVFHCSAAVGSLIPSGSILIPAANDNYPSLAGNPKQPASRLVGFVPHAPDALPIYKVAERLYTDPSLPGYQTVTLICENNGLYPWIDINKVNTDACPFWVIPPAFTDRSGLWVNGRPEPRYEQRSSIIAVIRRTIHLTEIP